MTRFRILLASLLIASVALVVGLQVRISRVDTQLSQLRREAGFPDPGLPDVARIQRLEKPFPDTVCWRVHIPNTEKIVVEVIRKEDSGTQELINKIVEDNSIITLHHSHVPYQENFFLGDIEHWAFETTQESEAWRIVDHPEIPSVEIRTDSPKSNPPWYVEIRIRPYDRTQ